MNKDFSTSPDGDDHPVEVTPRLHWPATLLGSLVVLLSGLASLRQPLGPWLPFVAAAAVLVAGIGASKMRVSWAVWALAGLSVFLVLADGARSLKVWQSISSHPDAWSYGAFADYLTHYPRGVPKDMSLFDQWGSSLQNSRFASPGLLALCNYLTGPDRLIQAHALFSAIVLVTLFFSMACLGVALGLTQKSAIALGFLTTAFGWTVNALGIGNYDNLVFVALFPCVLALWINAANGYFNRRSFLIHAPIVMSALFYAYPEGLALSGALLLPIMIAGLWRMRRNMQLLKLASLAGLIVIGLSASYLPVFATFLSSQLDHVSATVLPGARPGSGNFTGLLDGRFAPAFWSLGNEYKQSPTGLVFLIIPSLLFLLTGVGAWQLKKANPWFSWVLAPLLALIVWQGHLSRYEYGTYKVIFCAQWWLFPALICGGVWLTSRISHKWGRCLLVGFLVIGAGWQRWALRNHRDWPPNPVIAAASELTAVASIVGSRPLLIELDDPTAQLWALAYLRNQSVSMVQLKGYLGMPHFLPFLDKARSVPITEDMFTLRSGRIPGAVWQNAYFSLLSKTASSLIISVENPNGLEAVNGEPFIWIAAKQPTVFIIKSYQVGDFELGGTQLVFGPSALPSTTHAVEVIDAEGAREAVLQAGALSISIKLKVGMNRITLRSIAPLSPTPQANGDTRELMVGLAGYFVKSASPAQP